MVTSAGRVSMNAPSAEPNVAGGRPCRKNLPWFLLVPCASLSVGTVGEFATHVLLGQAMEWKEFVSNLLKTLVAGVGFEPTTFRL